MLNQRIPDPQDTQAVCQMIARWGISAVLGNALAAMTRDVPFDLIIYSGYRTCEKEADLEHGIPCEKSTHTTCPATGADITMAVEPTNALIAQMGAAGVRQGLRWGGGAPVDSNGIPVSPEWHHFDLGPRS